MKIINQLVKWFVVYICTPVLVIFYKLHHQLITGSVYYKQLINSGEPYYSITRYYIPDLNKLPPNACEQLISR